MSLLQALCLKYLCVHAITLSSNLLHTLHVYHQRAASLCKQFPKGFPTPAPISLHISVWFIHSQCWLVSNAWKAEKPKVCHNKVRLHGVCQVNGPPSGEGCDPPERDVRVTCVVCPEGHTGVLGVTHTCISGCPSGCQWPFGASPSISDKVECLYYEVHCTPPLS